MKKTLFVLLLFMSWQGSAHRYDAQCNHGDNLLSGARTTIADIGELDYDIKHVTFNLNLTNTSTTVSGDVTTTAIVTASSIGTYVFELNDTLTIDSVKINGTLQPVVTTHPGTRKVTLTTALPNGSVFTAQVFYHGTGPAGSGFFTHGMVTGTSAGGTQVMYTCGDPNWCSDWWPCKQSLLDKIDSVDMIVTVPVGMKAPSNGVLLSTTPVTGGIQYHWKTRYPIDYYLISVAVAPYIEYDSYIHYAGSTDSTPLHNFFYDTSTFISSYKKNFDSASLMVAYLSELYGRYPYDKEKFGYCYSTLNGGMENQTMVTIGTTLTPLIAHELGHQWFGDHVTYASWRDIWLSEGFACYTEQLFIEHFWGTAAMISYRTQQYNNVIGIPNGSVYVDDTTNVLRIFDGRLTYYKGAAVAHMLRYVAPGDSAYFQMLRNYQTTYAFGTATTDSLKNIAAAAYGKNMDTFFNQWIYGQGYPVYKAQWNQKDSSVFVQLTQTSSDSTSVPFFYTPIEIQLIAAAGDTTIKIYNDQKTQSLNCTWARTMTGMRIDPNNSVLHKAPVLNITHDPTLGLKATIQGNFKVYPNPAKEEWYITNVSASISMILSDMNGRTVWKGVSTGTVVNIPAKGLIAGNYILQLLDANHSIIQLIRW